MKTHSEYLKDLGFCAGERPANEEIKAAYRALILKEHPDRGGDPNKFRDAKEAYESLTTGKYLDDKDNPLNVPTPEDLANKATSYLYNLLNTSATKVNGKDKKKIVKLIGNKIVVIDNQATEDKFLKVDDQLLKVENK